jgi:hypothetical protein
MSEVSAVKNRSLPGQGHGSKYLSKILEWFNGSLAERKHPQDVYCAISIRDRFSSRVTGWGGIVKFERLILGFGDG